MSFEDLGKSLEGLRALRADLDEGQTEVIARVDALIGDLDHQIQNLHDVEHRGSLLDGLRNFAEQFEAEHPKLTATSNQISLMLSGMGI